MIPVHTEHTVPTGNHKLFNNNLSVTVLKFKHTDNDANNTEAALIPLLFISEKKTFYYLRINNRSCKKTWCSQFILKVLNTATCKIYRFNVSDGLFLLKKN